VCAIRWLIEQVRRELKQTTGVDACQCRKQRIQRNHIACAVMVWLRMKQLAYQLIIQYLLQYSNQIF
jgi:hypothetical protein